MPDEFRHCRRGHLLQQAAAKDVESGLD